MAKNKYALIKRNGSWMITHNIQSGDEVVSKLGSLQSETASSKVHQLASAHDSFVEAAQLAVELQKGQTGIVERAMIVAMIVAYGRPFKLAEHPLKGEARRPQIHESKATGIDAELHQILIWLRDQYIAHVDLAPGSKNTLRITIREDGQYQLHVTKLLKASKADYQRIEVLCRKLAAQLEPEVKTAMKGLHTILAKVVPGHYTIEHDGLGVRFVPTALRTESA
jgi:hypothetical protein